MVAYFVKIPKSLINLIVKVLFKKGETTLIINILNSKELSRILVWWSVGRKDGISMKKLREDIHTVFQ